MILLKAIVRPDKIDAAKDAPEKIGAGGKTVSRLALRARTSRPSTEARSKRKPSTCAPSWRTLEYEAFGARKPVGIF